MMYEDSTEEELLQAIENGWFVAWFAVEDDDDEYALNVDLCCNYRLGDRKIMFLTVSLDDHPEPEKLVRTIAEKAIKQWTDELQDKLTSSLKTISETSSKQ